MTATDALDRLALGDIAEACGGTRRDNTRDIVLLVRSMLRDPQVSNERRALALAVVRRLVDSLDDLVQRSCDPGTEAMGALWEARSFLANGGGTATVRVPFNVDPEVLCCEFETVLYDVDPDAPRETTARELVAVVMRHAEPRLNAEREVERLRAELHDLRRTQGLAS